MERFNLNTWLEDKSRKIVTRDGKKVRIICYDVKQGKDDCYVPIIALVDKGEEIGEMSYYYSEDGRFLRNPEQTHNLDLFFADNENTELTEFEEEILNLLNCATPEGHGAPTIEKIKEYSQKLLDLARNETYNPYKATVESIAEMAEKYEPYCWTDIDSKLSDFLNNVKVKCKDAMEYDKAFPQEEFVSKKQYEEDLEQAYKNADKVQFNRGMDEVLTNPQKYFHVGDTIRLKNSNAEHTITSIFNGKYYGERWCLDIMKAADDYELVEDCNEVSKKIDYNSEIIGFLKNYIKTYGCTAMNSWVKWLEKKCSQNM